jgi:hypothetical protein
MNATAWTGGSRPPVHARQSALYRVIRHRLFREQCETYHGFWGDLPIDVARIFWTRANYDAWASVRTEGE